MDVCVHVQLIVARICALLMNSNGRPKTIKWKWIIAFQRYKEHQQQQQQQNTRTTHKKNNINKNCEHAVWIYLMCCTDFRFHTSCTTRTSSLSVCVCACAHLAPRNRKEQFSLLFAAIFLIQVHMREIRYKVSFSF